MDGSAFGRGFETVEVARHLADSGEFRDPFGQPTGFTAHVAPVYPAILAAILGIFGYSSRFLIAILLVTAGLMGLVAALLPAVAQRIYGSAEPGIIGAVLLTVSSQIAPQVETALSAALLLIAATAVLKFRAAAAGLWAGLSVLTNPLSLPALGLLALHRGRRSGLIVVLMAVAVCVPWTLRNWVMVGFPYFVRDNVGIELYLSNSDRSEPELVRNSPLPELHPSYNDEEAAAVARMGEGPYNQMRLRDALAWIRSHPRRFLELSAGRVFYYWFPSRREGWPAYGIWAMTILAIAGAWLGRANRTARFIAAAALLWSLPFVLVQTDVRYRFPSLWMTALLAGYAVEILRRRTQAGRAPAEASAGVRESADAD